MARGSNGGGNNSFGEGFAYGFQQILEAPAHDFRDQGATVVPFMSWASSEAPLWVRVMVCVRFGGSSPNRVTDRPTHCHS